MESWREWADEVWRDRTARVPADSQRMSDCVDPLLPASWRHGNGHEHNGQRPGRVRMGMEEGPKHVPAIVHLGPAMEASGESPCPHDLTDKGAAIKVQGHAQAQRGGLQEFAQAVQREEPGCNFHIIGSIGGAMAQTAGRRVARCASQPAREPLYQRERSHPRRPSSKLRNRSHRR
ncbi:MAG: hypothetical protein JWO94_3492 [Verrucomicrobiaceae bacterium]|nr:hypothetical protein [Verrucomicrobiaceae bacterium]